MASIAGIGPFMTKMLTSYKKTTAKKCFGLGGLMTAGFCLFDFAEVPKAFKLNYNKKCEKVAGTNWESGIKEILKSIPKCAQMLILPALIASLPFIAGGSAFMATLGSLSAFLAPWAGYALLDKLLPHEEEEIKLICQEKGIDISSPQGTLA